MANHKSAIKRNRQNNLRAARNKSIRSRVRHAIKDARVAIEAGAEDKEAKLQKAVREVYRATSLNVLPNRTASRTVSRLMKSAQA